MKESREPIKKGTRFSLLPDPAKSVIEILHRVLSAVDAAVLFEEIEITFSFIVSIAECTVVYICHCFDLVLKCGICKIICAGCCENALSGLQIRCDS